MIASTPAPTDPLLATVDPRAWWREGYRRQPQLALFALVMLALMLPTAIAAGLDDRLLRGVNVWVKPLKFMASVGLFAFSTAWFVGLLSPAARRGRSLRIVVWTIIGAGSFEIAYITLQAALGQASHYNGSTPWRVALYSAMGLGATAMTATQALLAWRIARDPAPGADPVWRLGVVVGLVFTFVLGAGAGGLLGGLQPPSGAGLPLVGWQLAGDLRPAHFLGLHAQQFLPLAALALRTRRAVAVFAAAYGLLWLGLLAAGLHGAVPTPLPPYDGSGR